ncbi:DUF2975 domain-containing protein [Psychroserpens mesophilus]|uniref:DUF2975 domain-containing protein n=1 Tax=Psychroserpens mesophilus TaxID=325473 RepID=UPI003D647106
MKKIKFLNVFIILLIVIYIVHFIGNVYITFFTNFLQPSDSDFYKNFIFGYYTQFVGLIFSIITFIGLLFIKNGLSVIIKEDIFNFKSSIKFKTAGKLLLLSGFLSLIFSMTLFYSSQEITLLAEIGRDFLLMVIGFSLYIVADILQNGSLLRQENELTI